MELFPSSRLCPVGRQSRAPGDVTRRRRPVNLVEQVCLQTSIVKEAIGPRQCVCASMEIDNHLAPAFAEQMRQPQRGKLIFPNAIGVGPGCCGRRGGDRRNLQWVLGERRKQRQTGGSATDHQYVAGQVGWEIRIALGPRAMWVLEPFKMRFLNTKPCVGKPGKLCKSCASIAGRGRENGVGQVPISVDTW